MSLYRGARPGSCTYSIPTCFMMHGCAFTPATRSRTRRGASVGLFRPMYLVDGLFRPMYLVARKHVVGHRSRE